MVESVTRTRYFAGISRNTVLLAFASLFADISSAPHRFSLFVPVHWGCLPEASQAQGHRCWLESRHAFIGQARVPSPAPFGPFHRLRGAGTHETSGKRRRPTCRDWMSPFAVVSPEWRPTEGLEPLTLRSEVRCSSHGAKLDDLGFLCCPSSRSPPFLHHHRDALAGCWAHLAPASLIQRLKGGNRPFNPSLFTPQVSYQFCRIHLSFLSILRNKIHCRQHGKPA
jgi:hypothetical protein